ncbi:IpaD/SipD/SspD family type III secretion system needle tip protein [Pseudomonas fluorescens]|uniref:IpaD/SipD/SspD family type III secretion system needle tip protein n=1 Tax=Pseudomonas fluorescens TaxID=294 RepID=UPI000CA38C18|nr:IpaD/SipD/SspD family type III secretion system needle tip protein [Pseudomonas fluorescens]AUM69097.1 IpaD/SipD/SspD family type III secretion system needle tip protein [Pseudomonas fluorescens]
MEITQSIRSPIVSLPNVEAITDTVPSAEVPVEIQTVSSLTHLLERSMSAMNRSLGHLLKCPSIIAKPPEGTPTEPAAQHLIAEFVEQIHGKRDRAQMWAVQVRQCCAVMTHSQGSGLLEKSQCQQLNDEHSKILGALQEHLEEQEPLEIAEALDATISSSNDFFDKLLGLIDLIKNGYLAGYEHIIAAYSGFFSDFNTEITAMLKDWIEGVNDGKEVELSAGPLRDALERLIEKYSLPNSDAMLFPKPPAAGATKEEAQKWLEALGLPDSCLQQNPKPNGPWCVVIDIGPLNVMHEGLKKYGDTEKLDTAAFNAWQTGFNAQEELLKNRLQSFTQKYSNANAYHDNFNKTLSAHLNQYSDMLRAMLNF